MNPSTIALIVVALVALGAAFLLTTSIRRPRHALAATGAEASHQEAADLRKPEPMRAEAPADTSGGQPEVTVKKVPERERKPLTNEQLAVSRRQFLNRAWTMSFSLFLGFFGMSTLSFLWPRLTGGFGTKITVGDYEEVLREVGPAANFKPKFYAEGRFYLVYYEGTADTPVYLAVNAKETKLVALYRKCVHLGCSVPHCQTSMLFECPCHGSKYRLNGEYYGGPAPRGLDRFKVSIEGGKVVVDTAKAEVGPPRGTDTWKKFSEPSGPFCVPA